MKIVSVHDKRLKKLVENPSATSIKGFDPKIVRKLSDMIAAVRVMTNPLQLKTIESWKAHELALRFPGKWSLTVTGNYRLTFYVDQAAQEVSQLKYEDYH